MPQSTNIALYQDIQARIDAVTEAASEDWRNGHLEEMESKKLALSYLQESLRRVKELPIYE